MIRRYRDKSNTDFDEHKNIETPFETKSTIIKAMSSFLTEIGSLLEGMMEPRRQARKLGVVSKISFTPKAHPPSVTDGISSQHRAETESAIAKWKRNRK